MGASGAVRQAAAQLCGESVLAGPASGGSDCRSALRALQPLEFKCQSVCVCVCAVRAVRAVRVHFVKYLTSSNS